MNDHHKKNFSDLKLIMVSVSGIEFFPWNLKEIADIVNTIKIMNMTICQ